MSGQSDLTIGAEESMSRVPMGVPMGAWMTDPSVAFKTYLCPRNFCRPFSDCRYKYSRDDVDLKCS